MYFTSIFQKIHPSFFFSNPQKKSRPGKFRTAWKKRRTVCAESQASGLDSYMEELLNHWRELHDHRCEDDRHHAHQFDENVQRRTRRILAGIADGIADHGRSVNGVFGSVRQLLSAVVSFLDMLFRIIPRSARIVQQTGQGEAGGQSPGEESHQSGDPQQQSRCHRP